MILLMFLFACIQLPSVQCTSKPGVQIRLSRKGLKYLADTGKQILEREVKKTTFDENGSSGHLKYWLSQSHIEAASFPVLQLTTHPGTGLQASVRGAMVGASGKIKYEYKRKFIKFSDHISVTMKVQAVDITASVAIGATKTGEFTISMTQCSAHIGSIDIKFHGGWKEKIYNLLRHMLESKLRNVLNADLCDILRKEIDGKAREELRTFPVVSRIDEWSEIDYHLTTCPTYTTNYMDVFLKGEFKSFHHPSESTLPRADFTTSDDHDRMVYIWVSAYTVNTAGEVYQRSQQLHTSMAEWDGNVPAAVRKLLYTTTLIPFIPNVIKYPSLPLKVDVASHTAPKLVMKANGMRLLLSADAVFSAKNSSGQLIELFVFKIDIQTQLTAKIDRNQIIGKITDFTYDVSVVRSAIGSISTSLFTSPFVKTIVENLVIYRTKRQLSKGFPLPQLQHVKFNDAEVVMLDNAVRVGVDVLYKV